MRAVVKIFIAVLMTTPLIAAAQHRTPTSLFPPATGELTHEFTEVGAIFELADGRIVIVDRRDATVSIGDFRSKETRKIGRQGSGPGEYNGPWDLYPLGGDSVAVYDDRLARLLVLDAQGRIGRVASVFPPSISGAGSVKTDARGRFYAQAFSSEPDSAPLLTWQQGDQVRQIGYFRKRLPIGTIPTGGNTIQPGIFAAPSSGNLWTVSSEGRIAMIEFEPYRVRFLMLSGKLVEGKEIPYNRQAVNDSVKQAYLSESVGPSVGSVVDKNGAPIGATSGRAGRRMPQRWVEFLPPYRGDAFVAFDPTGTLWIQRTTFGREGGRYDLIGPNGELVGAVELPSAHSVVGFGKTDVYVVRRDSNDLQFVQRRPLPRRR